MCGRFTLFSDYESILERFAIEEGLADGDYRKSYNIAPSNQVLSIINDGKRNRIGYLRWGLVPSWAKDEKIGYKLINARAETLQEKPSFRGLLKKKRCLIVADSFYEWRKGPDGKSPMRIKLASGELFGMAGLWEVWKSPDGKKVPTCTIITTEGNELMSGIHERMPVIIRKEEEQDWLDPGVSDWDLLDRCLKPYDAEPMEAFDVSPLVNSPKHNSPELLLPI